MKKLIFSNGSFITKKGAANIWSVNGAHLEPEVNLWSFCISWKNEGNGRMEYLYVTGNEADIRSDYEKLIEFMAQVK